MQMRDARLLDQIQAALEHFVGFGGKSGDDVGAQNRVGPQPLDLLRHAQHVAAQVSALHAFQNQIVLCRIVFDGIRN